MSFRSKIAHSWCSGIVGEGLAVSVCGCVGFIAGVWIGVVEVGETISHQSLTHALLFLKLPHGKSDVGLAMKTAVNRGFWQHFKYKMWANRCP